MGNLGVKAKMTQLYIRYNGHDYDLFVNEGDAWWMYAHDPDGWVGIEPTKGLLPVSNSLTYARSKFNN